MNHIVFSILVLLLMSCSRNKTSEFMVLNRSKLISVKQEVVYYDNKKFNGVIYELSSNYKDTINKASYKDGLLDGPFKKWFDNKQLMEIREYHMGQKHGKQIAFWDNGLKRFEFNANNDAMDGIFKEWTVNGTLFHFATYINGREEGVQKMWYENGKIRANYIIINGRRYGLLGTKNCKNVSDSIFIVK